MMSEPDRVDFITLTPETGVLALYMIEHRSWDDTTVMTHDLSAKLNAYLTYILDGQLEQEHPGITHNKVVIKLDHAMPLTPRMQGGVDAAVKHLLERYGITLVVTLVPTPLVSEPIAISIEPHKPQPLVTALQSLEERSHHNTFWLRIGLTALLALAVVVVVIAWRALAPPWLVFNRSGGLSGTEYQLTLNKQGEAVMTRTSFKTRQRAQFSLTAQQLNEIQRLLSEVPSAMWGQNYTSSGKDLFTYSLRFQRRTTHAMDGGIPAPLQPIINTLNQLIEQQSAADVSHYQKVQR